MKTILSTILLTLGSAAALSAQTTAPVYTNEGVNIAPPVNTYREHSQQGREMYQNNAQWQNKDNVAPDAIAPSSNGQYITPGNSNAVNGRMYDGGVAPAGTIYNSGVPNSGGGTQPSAGSEAYIRD